MEQALLAEGSAECVDTFDLITDSFYASRFFGSTLSLTRIKGIESTFEIFVVVELEPWNFPRHFFPAPIFGDHSEKLPITSRRSFENRIRKCALELVVIAATLVQLL